MRLILALLAAALPPITPAFADAPSGQAGAISEGLDWFCADWIKVGAPNDPKPRPEHAKTAGWLEQRSAAPAVGPILVKGGEWGRANIVRVNQAAGHRCSISMQLSSKDWTTDTAHAAVADWMRRTWPAARLSKDRGDGPRSTRESVWTMDGDLSLTLQESPEAGAQPNVFITLQRKTGAAV